MAKEIFITVERMSGGGYSYGRSRPEHNPVTRIPYKAKVELAVVDGYRIPRIIEFPVEVINAHPLGTAFFAFANVTSTYMDGPFTTVTYGPPLNANGFNGNYWNKVNWTDSDFDKISVVVFREPVPYGGA